MMGMRMAETCWAVFKRQVINLRNCCIWFVDSFECMMMQGLANPKFKNRYFHYFWPWAPPSLLWVVFLRKKCLVRTVWRGGSRFFWHSTVTSSDKRYCNTHDWCSGQCQSPKAEPPQRSGEKLPPPSGGKGILRTYSNGAFKNRKSKVHHVYYVSGNCEGDFRTLPRAVQVECTGYFGVVTCTYVWSDVTTAAFFLSH